MKKGWMILLTAALLLLPVFALAMNSTTIDDMTYTITVIPVTLDADGNIVTPASKGGYVSREGGTYSFMDSVTIYAYSNDGYAIKGFFTEKEYFTLLDYPGAAYASIGDNTMELTFTVDRSGTFYALFAPVGDSFRVEAGVYTDYYGNCGTVTLGDTTSKRVSAVCGRDDMITLTANEIEGSGFRFAGWYEGAVSGSAPNAQITPVGNKISDADVRNLVMRIDYDRFFCAVYEKVFTFTFEANGGSGAMNPLDVGYGADQELPACKFTPPSGMHFARWKNKATGEEFEAGDTVYVSGDSTFEAVWEEGAAAKPGDMNGDGDVNTSDLILLLRKVNGQDVALTGNPDVSGDGIVNTTDLILLLRFVNGQDVELKS